MTDDFGPAATTLTTTDSTNAEVHPVAGADHFLVGRTDRLNALVDDFLAGLSA